MNISIPYLFLAVKGGGVEIFDTNLAAHADHVARNSELVQGLPKKEAPKLPSAVRGAKAKKRSNAPVQV